MAHGVRTHYSAACAVLLGGPVGYYRVGVSGRLCGLRMRQTGKKKPGTGPGW